MKLVLLLFMPFVCLSQMNNQDYPVYKRNDLGVSYSPKKTTFKIWAPTASAVKLNLYKTGDGGEMVSTVTMSKEQQGVWQTKIADDIKNLYYTFQVQQDGKWLAETPDIYAKAVGVNGKKRYGGKHG